MPATSRPRTLAARRHSTAAPSRRHNDSSRARRVARHQARWESFLGLGVGPKIWRLFRRSVGDFKRKNCTSILCHSKNMMGQVQESGCRNPHNPWESIESLSTSVIKKHSVWGLDNLMLDTIYHNSMWVHLVDTGLGRTVSVPAQIVKHCFTMCCEMCLRPVGKTITPWDLQIPLPRTEGQGSAGLVLPDSAVQHGQWNQRSFDLAPACAKLTAAWCFLKPYPPPSLPTPH